MENELWISATQDETWNRCPRQWWFQYPQKVPTLSKTNFDFGTILHEVCERYMLADDLGRVPETHLDDCPAGLGGDCECLQEWNDGVLKGQRSGAPVELFPDGWDQVTDRLGVRHLSDMQKALIRKLISKAIEEGVLKRTKGRRIEHRILRPLIPGVHFVGKVDVLLPDGVEDHKSTSAMRWSQTPESLRESLQMLDYAHEVLDANPGLETVKLAHNTFCKDPQAPVVRRIDSSVTSTQVIANWHRLKRQASQMQDLALAEIPDEDWELVEGPRQADACQAYGGCPFRPICGKVDTVEQYRRRVTKQINRQKNLQEVDSWDDAWGRLSETKQPQENQDVNVFERRRQRKATLKPSVADTQPIDGSALDETIATPPQAQTAASADTGAPPWAQDDCSACKGLGFNKVGNPCRICDGKSRKRGGPVSGEFVIENLGDGTIVWASRDGSLDGTTEVATSRVEEPKVQEKAETAPPKDEPEPEQRPKKSAKDAMAAIEQANQNAVEKAEAEAPKIEVLPEPGSTRKVGRPKKGYYIYIDCMPLGVETTPVEQVFASFAQQLADQQKVASYYDLDVFKRREAFSRAITEAIAAEAFNKKHLVVRNPSGAPDLRAFVDALVAVTPQDHIVQGIR